METQLWIRWEKEGLISILVDYWVEPRTYVDVPPTGWGPKFEEEDKNIQKSHHEEDFVGMIITSPKTIQI